MFRSKPSEESLLVSVRSELTQSLADLEGRRLEYCRHLESKKQARLALENAEAEVRRLHSESVTLQRGFWETYYRNGHDARLEVGTEARSLRHAIEKAEKSLKRARARWEEADFDEVAEWRALIGEADAVEEEVTRRINTLEDALGRLIVELREDLKEAIRTLHDDDEYRDAQQVGASKLAGDPRSQVQAPREGRLLSVRSLLQGKPEHRNLLITVFFPLLVGLLCLWIGLFGIKGEVLLALVLVGLGFVNIGAAAFYILPTRRWRSVPGVPIAWVSLALLVIGTTVRGLLL
jgi:hypothetical protein